MLRLDHVAMRYGDGPEVLHDLNLSLSRGEVVYLMGPTGAGKTSLLRLVGLLQLPSKGKLTLFERNVAQLTRAERSAFRRRIGMVFQDARLLEHLSAFDNVALPLRIHGARDDQIEGFVPELLRWLCFSAALDLMPSSLSLGQRQLIAVARAVIARPELLLCDEPTSNLDSKVASRLMHLLSQLSKLGTTVVVVTHSRQLVDRYRHPILRLADGYLSGPTWPASARVATGVAQSRRDRRRPPGSAAGPHRVTPQTEDVSRGPAAPARHARRRRKRLRRPRRNVRPRRRR